MARKSQRFHRPGQGLRSGIFPRLIRHIQTVVDVGHCPLRAAGQLGQLFPGNRHRYPKAGPGPCGPGGGCRSAKTIAKVVDEDLARLRTASISRKAQKRCRFALRPNYRWGTIWIEPPPGPVVTIPLRMQNPITLPRPDAARILIHADPDDITIICAWSVQIPRAKMLEYLRTVDKDTNAGFFTSSEGILAFAHGAARISFSPEEFAALQQFVERVYGPD